ncbi:uncharacterized protein EI90DRAFT_962380 [Cantharellus anzutake]|uniref:uncharacterized protein n=1 Tax=Cantharellus anzutake TaxID=1750568 RepID=UPI0019074136|nr:uncharacterized protein EI90DRAFT_962380 [Cantharellus anzutake]KAF8331714.1 hypothetical protein EI90DRAFT_962380 [Cantharellus anzutake]
MCRVGNGNRHLHWTPGELLRKRRQPLLCFCTRCRDCPLPDCQSALLPFQSRVIAPTCSGLPAFNRYLCLLLASAGSLHPPPASSSPVLVFLPAAYLRPQILYFFGSALSGIFCRHFTCPPFILCHPFLAVWVYPHAKYSSGPLTESPFAAAFFTANSHLSKQHGPSAATTTNYN